MMITNVFVGVCYTIKQNKKNSDRITVLQIQDKYDYSGIEFPVSLSNIKHVEEHNKVCVYVYEIDDETNDIIEAKKRQHEIY